MEIRNVNIKCHAEKLNELLDLLDVEYVEEIIISRTPQEFNHDYQTSIGLLEDDDFEDLGIEIKLYEDEDELDGDFDEDEDDEWNFIWDN